MTFHFYKGCVAWELQVGKVYFQWRLSSKAIAKRAGVRLRPNIPLLAAHYDEYGRWL